MYKKLATILLVMMISCLIPMVAMAGQWKRDKRGWWYQHGDGTYVKSDWLKDGDNWYYFDENGYMKTGWFFDGYNWFYLESNGAMRTGDFYSKGVVYRFNASGVCLNPYAAPISK